MGGAGPGRGTGNGAAETPCRAVAMTVYGRSSADRCGRDGTSPWVPRNGGVIAQLGERFNGIEEVVGSIPSGSTIRLTTISSTRGFAILMFRR